ncbi:unnamed protein product [Cuscuta epithymum]|uniref:RING-type E3 ubiquitin transferase n=1 Tax=Cuscuta epithymum TaxID=186058 RepID=A0AAV0GAN8_9ASTE|nr:unnamed protein product [Cuscuta epithymum]
MQGKRGAVGSLPETLDFAHGPSSGSDALGQPVCWNNLRSSAQNRLPDYVVSPNNTYSASATNQESPNLINWSLGESSSTLVQSQLRENEPKMGGGHDWSSSSITASTNALMMNNVEVNSEVDDTNDDDECQLLEFMSTIELGAPPNQRMLPGSSSSAGPLAEQSGVWPGSSGEGRRLSRKRKAFEGQSSGSGSLGCFQHPESCVWQHNISSSSNIPPPAPNTNNGSANLAEQINPRLGLSIGLNASRTADISRRNLRLRMNAANQQRSVPRNLYPLESQPENATPQGQPLVAGPFPSMHRHVIPSSYALSSGERDLLAQSVGESSTSRGIPRSITQQNLLFTPSGPIVGPQSASPSLLPSRAVLPQYPRLPAEFVRRSLQTSASASDSGRLSNSSSSQVHASLQEIAALSGGNLMNRPSGSRSGMLLERHTDGSSAVPYSWRTLAAAGEGRRSRLVSEIHNVLDLMRRGEGLRVEDVMILDPSVFFGMAGTHDRHRDMRLDVDNMSYEELLALEERIGNVCTGLSEEMILKHLKRQKYTCMATQEENPAEREPCCICQEEYNEGDELGILDCGHEYHTQCVKQWLKQKNVCAICKTTGLAAATT